MHAASAPTSVRIMSDLAAARALLGGYLEEDRRGGRHRRYLKKGSPEEFYARRALAEHLRSGSPVDHTVRMHLADLFDPPKWQQRKIEIESCRKGPHTDHVYEHSNRAVCVGRGKSSRIGYRRYPTRSQTIRNFRGQGQTDLGYLPAALRGRLGSPPTSLTGS